MCHKKLHKPMVDSEHMQKLKNYEHPDIYHKAKIITRDGREDNCDFKSYIKL